MSAFDVIVRIKDSGQFSALLDLSKPGDRQFKVRGPFGTPFVSIDHPFPRSSSTFLKAMMDDKVQQWMPDRMVFICSGTGITPFLQILSTYLMPVAQPQMVLSSYKLILTIGSNAI
jgi:NAD(P)H-flavin reductase